MLKNRRNILIHTIGSLIFLSLPILFSPDFNEHNSIIEIFKIKPFQKSFVSACILLAFFYSNYYVFIPKFYVPKKYFLFSSVILLSFIIVFLVPELLIIGRKIAPPQTPHYSGPPPKKPLGLSINHHLFQFLGVFVFSLLLKIRERLKQTEAEKTNAELSYLKAQINPHFLFNTLNSIYSLAILKSDKTADAVVKLSDMMRYVLNDSNANFTALEKELNYIANYIELQRMRLTKNVKLTYSWEGNIFDKKIAPLILIPFIENAFKHGVSSEEDSMIDVKIVVSETTLNLSVKNKCVTIHNDTLDKSGLGIENTKQRLNLLYPENHTLEISEIDNYYMINLTLNIHD